MIQVKKKISGFIYDMLFYISGCLIYSAAVTVFISPNKISPGGFTGISVTLNYLTSVPPGLILFILNVPVLIIGFIKMGGIFILKTAIATVLLSVSLEISEKLLPYFETDGILAAAFGGIFMGAGLSLVLLRGATTGGVDIIAKLINRKFRHLTVGRLILIMDAAVITFAAFTYKNYESALYSVVALYTSSRVMDTLLYGADKGKIVYIVTSNPKEICHNVNMKMNRGITRLKAVGGYTGKERDMLMCILRRHEISQIYSIINEYDKNAFIVLSDAGEIIGEGFKRF